MTVVLFGMIKNQEEISIYFKRFPSEITYILYLWTFSFFKIDKIASDNLFFLNQSDLLFLILLYIYFAYQIHPFKVIS